VGRVVEKPVVYQGEITKRSMLFLSLTFDRRDIDVAPAAAFLHTVKGPLEDPWSMIAAVPCVPTPPAILRCVECSAPRRCLTPHRLCGTMTRALLLEEMAMA
jgi:hypothetical protein